ncbi:MAG: ABC transporter ATP-binding protein, partial [Bacillota bacterium]
QVFGKLRHLCPAKLEGQDRGNLISMITSDIELLEVFYAHTISPIFIACLVSTTMVVILSQFHLIFGLTGAVAYAMTGVILPILMSEKAQTLYAMERDEFGQLSSHYLDSLRGLGDIEQMGCGEKRLAELEEKTNHMSGMLHKISTQDGKVAGLADILVLGFTALMLVESVYLFGEVSIVHVVVPTVLLLSSFGSVLALSRLSVGLSKMLAAGDRVLALLDEEPEVEEIQVGNGETPNYSGVTVNNLNFAYDEEEILKDFSVHFSENEIFGIYGKSGSGKSTLLKLLMRFWNAPKDALQISGVSLENIATSHLRDLESFMTQESDMFHKSIKDNVRIGNLNASDEAVVSACKKASLHEFIMTLPDGYDTIIGELGSTISSGEAQRIGLARAFLHDAPLLLLDEPTSNLDSLNEGIILKSLKAEKNKTIVMVSHRKSTMAICDRKIVMEHGRIS